MGHSKPRRVVIANFKKLRQGIVSRVGSGDTEVVDAKEVRRGMIVGK